MEITELQEKCRILEHNNEVLSREIRFGDLFAETQPYYRKFYGLLDTVHTNFDEHMNYTFDVIQMSRSRAAVTFVSLENNEKLHFVLVAENQPNRMLTILDFVWAAFMDRATEKAKEALKDMIDLCALLVKYTEGADYEKNCEIYLLDEFITSPRNM